MPATATLDATAPPVPADELAADMTAEIAGLRFDRMAEAERDTWLRTFTAIDGDEIRGDPRLEHGLADRVELPGVAHAELESHRLAPGEVSQLLDEIEQAGGRREGGVAGR